VHCCYYWMYFISCLDSPHWTSDSPLLRLHDHNQTHHAWYDSSGRVISPTQRSLPDNTQHSQDTFIPPCEIRTRNHRKRAAAIPPLRPRGHWDRLIGHKSWFWNRSVGSRLMRLIKRNFNHLHCFNCQNQYIAVNIVCLIIHHFLVPFSVKSSTVELDCDGKPYIRGLEL